MLLRSCEPEDAPALYDYLGDLDQTSDYNPNPPGVRTVTVEKWAERIAETTAQANGLMIVAMVGPLLVGEIGFSSRGPSRMAHHGHLGIGVRSDWRGRGLGEHLMLALLDWARAHPTIEKVCLGVFAENAPAIALYKKLGFVEECRRIKEFKYGPGKYMDDIQMSLWVKPPEEWRTGSA